MEVTPKLLRLRLIAPRYTRPKLRNGLRWRDWSPYQRIWPGITRKPRLCRAFRFLGIKVRISNPAIGLLMIGAVIHLVGFFDQPCEGTTAGFDVLGIWSVWITVKMMSSVARWLRRTSMGMATLIPRWVPPGRAPALIRSRTLHIFI